MAFATAAGSGKNTLFKRGDGASPEVFTTVAEITKIGKFGVENPAIQAVSLDSTMDDYIPSMLLKGGTMDIEALAIPENATQGMSAGMKADVVSGTRRNFKITYPTALGAKTYTFTALVTSWKEGDVATNAIVPVSFQLQVVAGRAWELNANTPFYYA